MKNRKIFTRVTFAGLAFLSLLTFGNNVHAAKVNRNAPLQNHTYVTSHQNHSNISIRKQNMNKIARKAPVYKLHSHVTSMKPIRATRKTTTIHRNFVNNTNNIKRDHHFHHVFKVAKSKLGDAYSYGANGPKKFDCSGFTQYIYRHGAHKILPRTASAQMNVTKYINRGHERKGDLAFFGNGNVSHVGMVIGRNRMIDAQNYGVVTEAIHTPWWHFLGYGRVR